MDVTQVIGIRPYAARADFTVGWSLKWLAGVSGAGVLQVMPALLAECSPEFRGSRSQSNPFSWDLEAFAFAPDARRLDTGTPNVLPAVASQPDLDHVLGPGVGALAAQNEARVDQLLDALRAQGFAIASPLGAAMRGGSVMVTVPGQLWWTACASAVFMPTGAARSCACRRGP